MLYLVGFVLIHVQQSMTQSLKRNKWECWCED